MFVTTGRMLERFWRGCGDCRTGEGCARVAVAGAAVDPPGAWTAAIVFLMPLATGLGGAWLGDGCAPPGSTSTNPYQAAGLVVGFAVGVAMARVMLWGAGRLRRRSKTTAVRTCE